MVNPTGFTRRGFPCFGSEDPLHDSDDSGRTAKRKRFIFVALAGLFRRGRLLLAVEDALILLGELEVDRPRFVGPGPLGRGALGGDPREIIFLFRLDRHFPTPSRQFPHCRKRAQLEALGLLEPELSGTRPTEHR